jgi:hypothetical protein
VAEAVEVEAVGVGVKEVVAAAVHVADLVAERGVVAAGSSWKSTAMSAAPCAFVERCSS